MFVLHDPSVNQWLKDTSRFIEFRRVSNMRDQHFIKTRQYVENV